MRKPASRSITEPGLLLLITASFHALSFAQMAPESAAKPHPSTVTPSPAPSPVFDVSTVKQNKSGESGSHSSYQNGRFLASNVLLKNLIQYQAYGVPQMQIVGGPKWLGSVHFDIEAKAGSAVVDQLRTLDRDGRRALNQQLFQQLLANRFHLAAHWETRESPIYSLTVTRTKPTLQPAKHPGSGSHTSANNGQFTAEGVTLPELARALTQELGGELGRVVVDNTGLQGRYDVALTWTPDTHGAAGDSDAAGPSIFTAIGEQLGLKLLSAKGAVPVLVIDHVEMPSEN